MFKIAALYKFASIDNTADTRRKLLAVCAENEIRGTLLVAKEGLNGTIAGSPHGIDATVTFIRTLPGFGNIEVKYSTAEKPPFTRMKVRLKKEIVKLGVEDLDPVENIGTYVEPQDWNALIDRPETILIDTRNGYEAKLGTFKGAIAPDTEAFAELPRWVEKNLDIDRKTPVAMFCTGGIRCEKSTAYLRQQGFENVYHLKGGILNYLEHVPEEQSRWEGECFVFDERVSVGHGLKVGNNALCHACKMPLTPDEQKDARTVAGMSCPHCHDKLTDEQRARFAERQRQIELAAKRGQPHIAANLEEARRAKQRARAMQRERSSAQAEPEAPAPDARAEPETNA